MTKILYFDCLSGISGDMTIGALMDLGVDKKYLLEELKKLNLEGWDFRVEKRSKNGIVANYIQVITEEIHKHNHESDDITHNHHHHVHTHSRNYSDILELINKSTLNDTVKNLAIGIFKRVAVAEAKVHNSTPEEVHFHEVGAVDSIIDIVGTAICIDYLEPDRILSSIVNDGYGFTLCQHGLIPIPAPAVVEIFADSNLKFKQINVDKELVTPTGAAIIAELAEDFTLIPEMKIHKVGYGAGTRESEIPNVLRVYLGEIEKKKI